MSCTKLNEDYTCKDYPTIKCACIPLNDCKPEGLPIKEEAFLPVTSTSHTSFGRTKKKGSHCHRKSF